MTDRIYTPDQLSFFKRRAHLRLCHELIECLEAAKKREGLTMAELAARIGMKPTQMSRILNGHQNLTVQTAEAVFRAFGARGEWSYTILADLPEVPATRPAAPPAGPDAAPAEPAPSRRRRPARVAAE